MAIPGNIADATSRRSVRPSRLWYWVAGGLLAGGAVCIMLAAAGFISVDRQVAGFQRVPVPGQAEVTLARPGGYILYIEQPGHCCSVNIGSGDSGQSPPFPSWSMRVLMRPAGGGAPVAISTWHGAREVYDLAGHRGQTAMSFAVGKAGRYTLRAGGATPDAIADLAVGRDIGRGTLVPLVMLLAGVLVLAPGGITVGAITFFRRRGARRGPLAAPGFVPPMPPTLAPGGWQPPPSPGSWQPPAPPSPGEWPPPPADE